MSDPWNGRVAIVTGGASGIGRALCHELARRGAGVVVADVDARGAQSTAGSVAGASARSLDVTDAGAVEALVLETARERGRLDLMFNNAGVGIWGDVRDVTAEQWRRAIDVNLWGAVHGSLAALGVMAGQRAGHIVNTASLAGLTSAPTAVPYATAKHAVVGFSISLRAEVADLGVRVSAVCPGPIETGFHDSLVLATRVARRPHPPAAAIDAARAARSILRAVRANRRLVVLPLRARRIWFYARWLPFMIDRINRSTVAGLRSRQREE
jgi:NAD(P)-dependent dehydrogenase (short-subunit alcohol dehydrogenase family)